MVRFSGFGIINFDELSEFQIEKFMKILEDDFMNKNFELGYKIGYQEAMEDLSKELKESTHE